MGSSKIMLKHFHAKKERMNKENLSIL